MHFQAWRHIPNLNTLNFFPLDPLHGCTNPLEINSMYVYCKCLAQERDDRMPWTALPDFYLQPLGRPAHLTPFINRPLHLKWFDIRWRRELTTMRFHMRAASATSVDTELQPGIRTIFMGSVYRRSYRSLVASPGSHWKEKDVWIYIHIWSTATTIYEAFCHIRRKTAHLDKMTHFTLTAHIHRYSISSSTGRETSRHIALKWWYIYCK